MIPLNIKNSKVDGDPLKITKIGQGTGQNRHIPARMTRAGLNKAELWPNFFSRECSVPVKPLKWNI